MRKLLGSVLAAGLLTGCAGLDLATVSQVVEAATAAGPLTDSQIASGLKEALATGTERTVSRIGRTDGLWRNAGLKIPLPDALEKPANLLRKLGQDDVVDEFHLSLNRAAEKAIPEAASVFANAIRGMTLSDVRGLLEGQDNAATEFFRRTTSDSLRSRFQPIVADATSKVGATQKYKDLVSKVGRFTSGDSLNSLDLDRYVTDRALSAVFTTLAEEEKKIRTDPAARTTQLLKKVFGGGA